jgi:hypothetical protein
MCRIHDVPVQKMGWRSADQPNLEIAATQVAIGVGSAGSRMTDFRHFAMTKVFQITLLEVLEVANQNSQNETRKFPEIAISSHLSSISICYSANTWTQGRTNIDPF